MAQNTLLAAATTAATSTDVVIAAAGATVSLGIFVASGTIPVSVNLAVILDTPGGDLTVGTLSHATPAVQLSSQGIYRVVRPDISHQSTGVGVFSEA